MKRRITRQKRTILPRMWIYLFLTLLLFMTLTTFLLTEQKSFRPRTNPKMNVFLPHEMEHEAVVEKGLRTDKLKTEAESNNDSIHLPNAQKDMLVQNPDIKIPHLIFGNDGKGQNGDGVYINKTKLSVEAQKLFDEGYQRNAFNNYVSDLISVDRQPPPNARDPLCLSQKYPDDLPDTSIIITFLNEAWSVLVRTVHSIINTSPSHLLREIILVDDFSEYDYLKAPLEEYMKKFPKVKIFRNQQREGLIRSRLNGAKLAAGKVLTFLDSHIECAIGWLPPLLTRIKQDPSIVAWPAIPTIDQDTLKFIPFTSASSLPYGVFDWKMGYIWKPVDVKQRETPISPIKSPTMAGGLFSIDREFFYHIGSYDDQMVLWGAENLEISFRIWMCGGSLEIIPCSVIGHIYRKRNVNVNAKNVYALTYNTVRTAVVWMDQYKYLYSKYNNVNLTNYGNVSSRIELRKNLKCKSFQWYLDNIFTEAFIPSKAVDYGLLRNAGNPSLCLHATDASDAQVAVRKCNDRQVSSQVFYTTHAGELRLLTNCMDVGKPNPIMFPCHGQKGNQELQVREDRTIFSPTHKKCMQWHEINMNLQQVDCDQSIRQQWIWEHVSLEFMNQSE